MAKTELKTRPTKKSATAFIQSVADPVKKADSKIILKMMQEATGEKAVMWGPAIVGFGSVFLKYASGRELDWPLIGFSPRKQNLTLYLSMGNKNSQTVLKKLGKHSTSKACLYIKRLSDVDLKALKKLIELSLAETYKQHPESR